MDQPWLGSVLRPLLVITLVLCINVVFVTLLGRFAPELSTAFTRGLLLLASLAAVVGALSTTILAQPTLRLSRTATVRMAELGVFLIATRLLVWLTAGGFPSMRQIVREPITSLIDPLFVVAAFVVSFAWLTAAEVTGDLNQLGLGSDELYVAEQRSSRSGDPMRASGINRREILNAFAMRWASLGVMLIALTALLRREMRFDGAFALMRQQIEPAVMTAVILYFLAGLLLLSHGQLALLRSRWTLDRLPSAPEVTQRWPFTLLAVLGAIALLALLLPFGGTFLLASALSFILSTLMAVVLTFYRLALFGLLWLLSVLGIVPPPTTPQSASQPIVPPPAAAPAITAQLPEWLGAAMFYGLLALLCLYALRVYLGDRELRAGWLTWVINAFRRRWAEWRALLRRQQQRLVRSGGDGKEGGGDGAIWPWSLLLRGDPDHKVRALYLATLRRAADEGTPRADAETPFDFAPRLEQTVEDEPESSEAVRLLTDAFVDVRYAGRHADEARAGTLHKKWQALDRALRRHKTPPAPPPLPPEPQP